MQRLFPTFLVLPLLAACAVDDGTPYDVDLYVAPGEVQCDTPDSALAAPAVVEVLPSVQGIASDEPVTPSEEKGDDPFVDGGEVYLLGPDGTPRVVRVGDLR